MISVKNLILGSIGLVITFLILSELAIPFFAESYEYCTGGKPFSKEGTGTVYDNGCCMVASSSLTGGGVACTDCNQTAGYEDFLSKCGRLIDTQNNTHCYGCTDWGTKTTTRGMGLLVLVLALISFAIYYIPKGIGR